MITYKSGRWGVHIIFACYGSVFPKAFVWAASAACFAALWVWLSDVSNFEESSDVTQLRFDVLKSYDFVLGFLIVFRSQTAHSRWWEAGTLMQQIRGEWFNAYSNLIAFCTLDDKKKDEVDNFQQTLARLVSVLYGCALQQVSHMEDNNFDMLGISSFENGTLNYLAHTHDRCEVVLQWIQRTIVHKTKTGIIEIPPPILSRVYQELSRGIVNLNNARKISEFPFPFPYAQMVMALLIIQWIMTPIVMGSITSSGAVAGLLTFVQIFAYWAITYIAQELEAPYGDDANDLPLKMMQEDMNESLMSLLSPIAQEPPMVNLRGNLDPGSRNTLATVKVRTKPGKGVLGVKLKSHTAPATTLGSSSSVKSTYSDNELNNKPRAKVAKEMPAADLITTMPVTVARSVPHEPPVLTPALADPSGSRCNTSSGRSVDSKEQGNAVEFTPAMEAPRKKSIGTDQERLPKEQDRMPLKADRGSESGEEEDSKSQASSVEGGNGKKRLPTITRLKRQDSPQGNGRRPRRQNSAKPAPLLSKPPDSTIASSQE